MYRVECRWMSRRFDALEYLYIYLRTHVRDVEKYTNKMQISILSRESSTTVAGGAIYRAGVIAVESSVLSFFQYFVCACMCARVGARVCACIRMKRAGRIDRLINPGALHGLLFASAFILSVAREFADTTHTHIDWSINWIFMSPDSRLMISKCKKLELWAKILLKFTRHSHLSFKMRYANANKYFSQFWYNTINKLYREILDLIFLNEIANLFIMFIYLIFWIVDYFFSITFLPFFI